MKDPVSFFRKGVEMCLRPVTEISVNGWRRLGLQFFAGVIALAIAAPSWAQKQLPGGDPGNNNPPPAGAILDLAGTPVPGGGNTTYQQYTVNFTATLNNTAITFAFREDPAFIFFSNPSVTDQTAGGGNLLVNSDFSGATFTSNGNSSTPVGWIYANVFGATFGGVLRSNCGVGPGGSFGVGNCWFDGAVQAYDALTQTIATIPGHSYQISFWIADNSGCFIDGGPPCNFSDLSTNGDTTDTQGNGIDVTVYAAAALPTPAALHIELARDASGSDQGMLALATAQDISGNPVNMQDAARQIGFDHFNYLQIIVSDLQLQACAANMSLSGCVLDATITGSVPTLPTSDPPLGGYAYESSSCPDEHHCHPSFPTQDFWSMYWDEVFSPVAGTNFYVLNPSAPEYLSEYRQGNTLANVGATGVAPSQAKGFSFSDQPNTSFIVPGTTSTVEKINFVTALVGITGTCNQLISTNCAFQIFPGTTFKWTSTNGGVSFTATPGSTPGAALFNPARGRARELLAKTPDDFPVNPVDLTGAELVNSVISVDEFLALANLTPDSLAAMGGSISIFSGSLIPSQAAALAAAQAGDTTPPTTTATPSPAPNVNGWNNTDVTVTLSSLDNPGGSGVRQITITLSGAQTGSVVIPGSTASVTITAQGVTTITYFGTDNAGNQERPKTLTVMIDKTPPTAMATISPGPNANGWNNTNVTVSFTGSDALSGIDFCTSPIALTTEGAAQSVSGTCTDRAGNISSPATAVVNIDKTPPVISGMPAPGCSLWPPNGKMVQVGTVTASDSLSGVAPGSFQVTGSSNEPPSAPEISIAPNGPLSFTVQLEARRLGSGTGRIYTLTAIASDLAGNATTSTASCTVPHDQGN